MVPPVKEAIVPGVLLAGDRARPWIVQGGGSLHMLSKRRCGLSAVDH